MADLTEETLDQLDKELASERSTWQKRVAEAVRDVDKPDRLSSVQVHMLSYRQMAVERIAYYKAEASALKARMSSYRNIRYAHYKRGADLRYSEPEIKLHIDGDLALRKRRVEAITAQAEFLGETVMTLDKLGYAVSNRIELEKLHLF